MNKKKIITAIVIAFSSSAVLADNATTEFQATSTLTATCTLSANSVNFGAFMLPLSSQSAGSSLTMLCSNKAPYTIDLAYGGVYGQGSQGDGTYWVDIKMSRPGQQMFAKYSASGQGLGSEWVDYDANNSLQMVEKNLGCTFNAIWQCVQGKRSYDYGIMTGAAKGDSVAYSIFVPGDNSKVWNAGKNSYSGVGTGQEEQISFQAKIVPSQSGSAYPAPDFYMDTVTAIIKY